MRRQIKVSGGNASDDLNHPIRAKQLLDGLALLYQVVADADFRHRDAIAEKHELGYRRVQDYVPMVRHQQELAFLVLDVLNAVVRKIMDGVIDDPYHSLVHHFLLKFIYAVNASESVSKIGHRLVWKKIFRDSKAPHLTP